MAGSILRLSSADRDARLTAEWPTHMYGRRQWVGVVLTLGIALAWIPAMLVGVLIRAAQGGIDGAIVTNRECVVAAHKLWALFEGDR